MKVLLRLGSCLNIKDSPPEDTITFNTLQRPVLECNEVHLHKHCTYVSFWGTGTLLWCYITVLVFCSFDSTSFIFSHTQTTECFEHRSLISFTVFWHLYNNFILLLSSSSVLQWTVVVNQHPAQIIWCFCMTVCSNTSVTITETN